MSPKPSTILRRLAGIFLAMTGCLGCANGATAESGVTNQHIEDIASVEEMLTARRDLWGEAALRQPGGPSYEFFRDILPPLRYVDARFKHYPIVLSAPGAKVKGRFISNGSTINALARQPNWRNETGMPVHIRVGRDLAVYGEDLEGLDGPVFAESYLPIVQLSYRHNDHVYAQETFAATEPALAEQGVIFVRFSMPQGEEGKIEAQLESGHEYMEASNDEEAMLANRPPKGEQGVIRDSAGNVLALFDDQWVWNKYRSALMADPKPGQAFVMAIFTKRSKEALLPRRLDAALYDQQREHCTRTWNDLLSNGMTVEVPEEIVNDSWRGLLIGSYMLLNGDEIRYSMGNQYDKLYIGEGGDAARSFMLWGHTDDGRRMIEPLFHYTRKALEFHQAAFKLQMLAHYYALTQDLEYVRSIRPLWEKELNVILNSREKETGMLPREKYCGDIDTLVYSLNSNSNCWRALREMSLLLEQLGETKQAQSLAQTAAEYRTIILQTIEQATRRDVDPPFVPIALSGEEKPHKDGITDTRIGSYWNLMINYVLGSGVFTHDSQTANDIVNYLRAKGGLCMGMLRSQPGRSFWVGGGKINDLYGMRYSLLLLQRDDVDHFLVGFYGKLAQGMTRDTYIDGEGSAIKPLDKFGRQFYLPPNSAGNANFLQQFRYMLVQDYDMDDDGRPETLRLLFATPRKWLEDGKQIKVSKSPTTFGEVSLSVKSKISAGNVSAELTLPEPGAKTTLLRLRVPEGYRISGATAGSRDIALAAADTLDLSGLKGTVQVTATVEPRAPSRQ